MIELYKENYSNYQLNKFEVVEKDKIKIDSNPKSSSIARSTVHKELFAEYSMK